MNEDINDAAARWNSEQGGDAMDWDGFTLWLEADPLHRQAFDAIALLDGAVAAHRATITTLLAGEPSGDASPRWLRRGVLAVGGSVAAGLALFLGLPRFAPTSAPVVYATVAGDSRQVTLRDGSRVVLAPTSKLSVGEDQERLALMGSAYFDVRHRTDRKFTVEANGLSIRDIGTRFAIDAGASGTRVSVAQGSLTVSMQDASDGVPLAAGRSFMLARGTTSAQLSTVRADDVGSWRRGELVYDAMPLALVADDINRYARLQVTVDPRVSGRRFSGVLSIGDGAALAKSVAAIMALRVRTVDGGVRLEPGGKS